MDEGEAETAIVVKWCRRFFRRVRSVMVEEGHEQKFVRPGVPWMMPPATPEETAANREDVSANE